MLLRVLSIFVFFIIMISRFMSLLRLLSLHLPLLSLPEIIIISDDAHESLEHRLLLAGAELIRLLLEFNLNPKLRDPILKQGPVEAVQDGSLRQENYWLSWQEHFLSHLFIDQHVLKLLVHEAKEEVLGD